MLYPFLAGLCFGSWPVLMRGTNWSGAQGGFMISVITVVMFIPLWRGDTTGFSQRALILGVSAGLLNGVGSIFYQKALADPKLEISRTLLVVLVTTILITTVGARLFYVELLDTKKLIGLAFGLIGVVLLSL